MAGAWFRRYRRSLKPGGRVNDIIVSIMPAQIIFDPRLSITAEEFAAQWRETPENRGIGQMSAEPFPHGRQTFGEPGTAIAVLTGILLGVPSNAIWDALKATYQRLCHSRGETAQDIEIEHTKHPDGTEVTIIRLKD